jgi:hypothetical protein
MAKSRFIAVYGGTQLTKEQELFAGILARALLKNPSFILVTGGFDVFEKLSTSVSTDRAVADVAVSYLRELGTPVKARLETWLPDKEEDRLSEGVKRLRKGAVRQRRGESDRARRFALVRDVDAIVTISGTGNTETVLDLAYTIGKPALPLAFTGGDSASFWSKHKLEIKKRFRLDDSVAANLERVSLSDCAELETLAAQIAEEILPSGIRRRCLVLIPFDSALDSFYEQTLRSAIEDDAGFEAVRIDRRTETGDIYRQFLEHLERCEAVIVDVTHGNPNVMYELGHAHARRIYPLLLYRGVLGESPETRLPFYLLSQKIEAWDESSSAELFKQRIVQYLVGEKSQMEIQGVR